MTSDHSAQRGTDSPARLPAVTPAVTGWRRGLLCGLAAVPFLVATATALVPERPAPIQPGPLGIPLVFEQYQINLGPVPSIQDVGARYAFTNRGRNPIRITQLEPSCGCLNPRLEKRNYAPGESGFFFLRVPTAGQDAGPKEFSVRVHFEELSGNAAAVAKSEPIELGFKLIFPARSVTVRPRALVFYQLSPEETSQNVMIVDERDEPLEITEILTSTPLVTAVRGESNTADGITQHAVRVTVSGNVPPGRSRALVTVKTNDPRYSALQIPLILQGPDHGRIAGTDRLHASPPQLAFPIDAGLLTPPQDVTITAPDGKPFKILGVDTALPLLNVKVVESTTDAAGKPQVRVRVQLTGIPDNRSVRDVVTLRTNSPTQPIVQVPITIGSPTQQTSGQRTTARPVLNLQ